MPASRYGRFESIVSLWKSKCVADALPKWRSFEFEDFIGWYGHLSVGDIASDNGDVRFRLWGTALVKLFGCDLTGKCMSDAEPGFFEPYDFEHITEIVTNGAIMISSGPMYWQDRVHMTVHTIKLPLADNGRDIDKILWAVLHSSKEGCDNNGSFQ